MLAELAVQDRRQQVRTSAATGDWMERRRRLRDRLAGPAREFFPHRLNDLVAARDALKRLGDSLTELGKLAAAARATLR